MCSQLIPRQQDSSLDFGGNSTLSPQILDKELKDLSTLVSQELECVNQIIVSQPQEVPAQLLKALEKDAKNLQKSFNSVTDTWSSRLLHLQSAVEVKKVASCPKGSQSQGRLGDFCNLICHLFLRLKC